MHFGVDVLEALDHNRDKLLLDLLFDGVHYGSLALIHTFSLLIAPEDLLVVNSHVVQTQLFKHSCVVSF